MQNDMFTLFPQENWFIYNPGKALLENSMSTPSALREIAHRPENTGGIAPADSTTELQARLAQAAEYEACMLAMDRAGVPRQADSEVFYSLWGRACWMARHLKKI